MNQINDITMTDILNLRIVKQDKTLNTHLERIKKGKFEKNEINALTKLFSSRRFATEERKASINALRDLAMNSIDTIYNISQSTDYSIHGEIVHFKKPMRISKDQTTVGKQWLRNYFFKLNGSIRDGKSTEDVSNRVLTISKNVKRFEFIGLLMVHNTYGVVQVLPIYRTYHKSGQYFDYSPVHWGQPVIMEGY